MFYGTWQTRMMTRAHEIRYVFERVTYYRSCVLELLRFITWNVENRTALWSLCRVYYVDLMWLLPLIIGLMSGAIEDLFPSDIPL